MKGGPPRVLILAASYGSGHTRAASVLEAEFRRAGAAPTVVDHFRELVDPRFDRWSRALYYGLLHRAPAVWGGAYWLGDQINVGSPLLLGMNRIGVRRLRRLLRAQRFEHVVSVHPTPAAALSHLRLRGEAVPPHTTVLTDFVAHAQWVLPAVDRYCVPAEEIARELIARGVPRGTVAVTGIPVTGDFREHADRASARLALGLSPRLPVLLLMDGSSAGFGRLEEAVRGILAMEHPLQALIVAGHGRALEARLRRLTAGHEPRIKVFGYVEHVRPFMAAADFIVTKAGGLTLAEALAAELPIVCFGSVPGQEARNERFAAMAGIGLVAGSTAQLQRVIAAALRDPGLLQSIRDRARLYSRPRAARDIVALALGEERLAGERAS